VTPEDVTKLPVALESSRAGHVGVADCDCNSDPKSLSWVERFRAPKDLILRPTTHMAEKPLFAEKLTSAPARTAIAAGAAREKAVALRARMQDSVSLVVNVVSSAVMEAVSKDLREIYDAFDELLRALGRQIALANDSLQEVKSRAYTELTARNSHAKESAKKLKEIGEHVIGRAASGVAKHARDVFDHARNSAKLVQEKAAKIRSARHERRKSRVTEKKKGKSQAAWAETERKRSKRRSERKPDRKDSKDSKCRGRACVEEVLRSVIDVAV